MSLPLRRPNPRPPRSQSPSQNFPPSRLDMHQYHIPYVQSHYDITSLPESNHFANTQQVPQLFINTPRQSRSVSPMSSPISSLQSTHSHGSARKRRAVVDPGDSDNDAAYTPTKSKNRTKKAVPKKRSAPKKQPDSKKNEFIESTSTSHADLAPDGEVEPGASTESSGRPKRERKAPQRYADPPKTPKKEPRKPNPPKRRMVWEPDYLLTHSRSRLVSADLQHLLTGDRAWDILDAKDQAELVALLPNTSRNGELKAQIASDGQRIKRPIELDLNNDCVNSDIAKFQRDLADGYHSKKWQKEASKAMALRAEGVFDEWKEANCEAYWGQKMEY